MVTEERSTQEWGPRPGEDWRAHRMRVFADYPEMLAVLRIAESREHEAEIWRARAIEAHAGDPEMLELIREANFDLNAPPEMDVEDMRLTSNDRPGQQQFHPLEDVLRELAAEFPDEADDILSGQ